MKIKDWIAEVVNPIRTLSNLSLLLDEQEVVTTQEKKAHRIGFPEYTFEESMSVAKLDFCTLTEYMQLLRTRSYSALLFDGSLLQISLDIERDDLVKHRYCYYPCPVQFKDDELRVLIEEEPIADVIETFLTGTQSDLLLRSPIRFDFSSRVWKPGEPHAHVHFNHADCRCALSTAIYPGYFVKFVIRNFYPQVWHDYPVLELLTQDMIGYWLKDEEEQFIHFSTKRAPSDYMLQRG